MGRRFPFSSLPSSLLVLVRCPCSANALERSSDIVVLPQVQLRLSMSPLSPAGWVVKTRALMKWAIHNPFLEGCRSRFICFVESLGHSQLHCRYRSAALHMPTPLFQGGGDIPPLFTPADRNQLEGGCC